MRCSVARLRSPTEHVRERYVVDTVANKIRSAVADTRKPEYPIEPLIFQRWSPRAMSGEALGERELMTLFEAARWAPSSYNGCCVAQVLRVGRKPRPHAFL
jgi:hypothetical protein